MPNQHIKMPGVLPRVQYTANGIDTSYEFPFPIFATEDIQITFDGVNQVQGFVVTDVGNTDGGSVVFDTPPSSGIVITIIRQVPYERYTDFLESGDFSAKSLNNELDYLTASIQQLARDNQFSLRYSMHDNDVNTQLPSVENRAGRALGFDENGNPIAVDYGLTQSPTNFTAVGLGAITRNVNDKLSDMVSIRDFGAVGDGVADDTLAIGSALQAHDAIYIPSGTYRITNTIQVGFGQKIYGAGQGTIVKADSNLFDVLNVRSGYCIVSDFKIEGGKTGVFLSGQDTSCVQNRFENLIIENVNDGIILDGGGDANKPCYWNHFTNCLMLSPSQNGIHLTRSGINGDTPNTNVFDGCRVYSNGSVINGHGVNVEHGSFYNRFVNCEINVDGGAQSCMTIGVNANETVIYNLHTESSNGVPNLVLKSGSKNTFIHNLLATSDGAAIDDQSGGNYQSLNAGYPTSNKLGTVQVDDFTATLTRADTVFVEAAGVANIALTTERSVHLVSANQGEITINLPLAASVQGATYTIKKIDYTGNAVRISEPNGLGVDRKDEIILGGPYDYITILSNGSEWFVKSLNRMAGNTKYFEANGQIDIDMSVDTYLISSYGGVVTCRLPPANAAKAIGRTITIKKTDNSTNAVYVSEQGGAGPDQYTQPLNTQYNAITVVSNGAQWYIVNKF
jgi:hypothetical protein